MNNIKKVFFKTLNWFKDLIPILFSILLLTSILKNTGVFDLMKNHLSNNIFSVFIADFFWSVSAWSAINSYIIADWFGNLNEYFLVITVFLIAWVTVGIIQLPAEIQYFWKKFAIIRNTLSFLFAIIASYIIYLIYFI